MSQTLRTQAAKVMDHPAVHEYLTTELDTTVKQLIAAKPTDEFVRLQARAQILQQLLTDIENVRKQLR